MLICVDPEASFKTIYAHAAHAAPVGFGFTSHGADAHRLRGPDHAHIPTVRRAPCTTPVSGCSDAFDDELPIQVSRIGVSHEKIALASSHDLSKMWVADSIHVITILMKGRQHLPISNNISIGVSLYPGKVTFHYFSFSETAHTKAGSECAYRP
ncbi:hypothetical protein BC938DRAFT_480506 [Jimgerdemannia flammicorona]|uniref:Uncharacterized protein n=1 Tax=Jimgerdemannia flammicorona TaxID=994334 RepID=A0A433QIF2_9FUNG|nr:hypothetical protein BC938DRAFT_480506 [Jimgerdemannia flammicorona]